METVKLETKKNGFRFKELMPIVKSLRGHGLGVYRNQLFKLKNELKYNRGEGLKSSKGFDHYAWIRKKEDLKYALRYFTNMVTNTFIREPLGIEKVNMELDPPVLDWWHYMKVRKLYSKHKEELNTYMYGNTLLNIGFKLGESYS
jgi:hypothetical protein